MNVILRFLTSGPGLWVAPLALAATLATGGVAAGYVSSARESATLLQAPTDPTEVIPVPGKASTSRFGVSGQLVRLGVRTNEGQIIIVKDKQERQFRVLITPQTLVRKDGKPVPPTTLRPNDILAGIGLRDRSGVFRARAIQIVTPK